MLPREPQLQRFVLAREAGVASEYVAEREPLAPEVTARLGEMETMRRWR